MINKWKLIKNKIILRQWITVLSTLLLFGMCQEPYLNSGIDPSEKLIVFNATYTNINSLNSFELYYAAQFGTNNKIGIDNAIINIHSSQGIHTTLIERNKGEYMLPDNAPDLEINELYWAELTLPDGQFLRTKKHNFLDTIEIKNTSIIANNRTRLVKNESGEYSEVTEYGILVRALIEQPDYEAYLKCKSNFYVHSQRNEITTKPFTKFFPDYSIECEIRYDTLFDVYKGFGNSDFPGLSNFKTNINYPNSELTQEFVFIVADERCSDFTQYTQDRFIEWIVPIDVYNLNSFVYQFYKDVETQLNAPFQIYDPIPEQIIGNTICETDSAKTILGLFDVSTVNRKYLRIFVRYYNGYSEYSSSLMTEDDIKGGKYYNRHSIDTIESSDTTFFK